MTIFSITTRDSRLPLPPESGKGGTNEMPWNYYQAFEAYGQQTIRKPLTQSEWPKISLKSPRPHRDWRS
jgi:hypothetical protein